MGNVFIPGNTTAFVHRGHQNQHKMKVPCSCFNNTMDSTLLDVGAHSIHSFNSFLYFLSGGSMHCVEHLSLTKYSVIMQLLLA